MTDYSKLTHDQLVEHIAILQDLQIAKMIAIHDAFKNKDAHALSLFLSQNDFNLPANTLIESDYRFTEKDIPFINAFKTCSNWNEYEEYFFSLMIEDIIQTPALIDYVSIQDKKIVQNILPNFFFKINNKECIEKLFDTQLIDLSNPETINDLQTRKLGTQLFIYLVTNNVINFSQDYIEKLYISKIDDGNESICQFLVNQFEYLQYLDFCDVFPHFPETLGDQISFQNNTGEHSKIIADLLKSSQNNMLNFLLSHHKITSSNIDSFLMIADKQKDCAMTLSIIFMHIKDRQPELIDYVLGRNCIPCWNYAHEHVEKLKMNLKLSINMDSKAEQNKHKI